jgi:RND family efflux transporter MFP subunit
MYKGINLILALSLFVITVSCKNSAKQKKPNDSPVDVSIFEVQPKVAVYHDTYPANVVALKEVEIRGNVGGYVRNIFFNEGQIVHKGQSLYEIDRCIYKAAKDVAQANLEIAQANLAKVQLDADRYTELDKKQAIAKQILDHTLTDLENSKLQLAQAKAELIKATTDYDYSLISAPFDGIIGISQVRTGALIVPGATLMNTISTFEPMGVEFSIDEKEIERFMALSKKVADADDSTFKIILPDNNLYPSNGKISFIDRAVDPQTGTIKVRLEFRNPDQILRPGMSCNVWLANISKKEQIIIPYTAVIEQMGEYFVFKVNGEKVNQIKIALGNRIGNNVIVNNGLLTGDKIVVDGIQKLHDGSLIATGTGPKTNINSAFR